MSLKKNLYNFVFVIPILFALVLNLTSYFPPRGLNPGTMRGFLALGVFLIFLFKYYPVTLTNKVILFFILYIGLLSITSSTISNSMYGYMKFFIATMMFPFAYYFINSHDKLLKLSKIYIVTLFIFMLNIFISNIFHLGSSDYLEDSFYFGAGRVNITKSTIIIIFASLIFLFSSNYKHKKLLTLFIIISTFITIIGIKRSVILSLISGFMIFGITSKSKIVFLRIVFILSIVLSVFFLLFPNSLNVFFERIEAREEQLDISDHNLDKEARYNETNKVLDAWVNGSLKHKLFGSEMFNDAYFFKTNRMLHTDYMVLIAGSGVLGITWWFVIFFIIIKEKEKYWKYLKKDVRFQYYSPVFYSIIVAQFLMSISGTIQGIDLRSFIMLFLGGIVGSLRGEFKNLQLNLNNV